MIKVLYVNVEARSCLVEESTSWTAKKRRLIVMVAGKPEPQIFDEGSASFPANPNTAPGFISAAAFAKGLGISHSFVFSARLCLARQMTVYFNHQSDHPTPVPAGTCCV